jgi:hypothetical protein
MEHAAANVLLVISGTGHIGLKNSAKYLDQLRVRIDRAEPVEQILTKPRAAASEAIHEIGLASDQQFAERRD